MGLLRHPLLAIGLKLLLAGVFIYASWHKISEPPDFAKQIFNYKVTPGSLVNLVAIYLPWVEVAAGLALVLSIFKVPGGRGATVLIGLMLVVFIAAIGFNLARGNAIACGCFETMAAAPKTCADHVHDMWMTILRDVGMLAAVGVLLLPARAAPGATPAAA